MHDGMQYDSMMLEVIMLVEKVCNDDACTGSTRDDLVLEVIMLVGTVCNDDACAKMLAQAGIIQCLIELLNGNSDSSLCLLLLSVAETARIFARLFGSFNIVQQCC